MTVPDSYYSPEDVKRAKNFLQKISNIGSGTIELDLICKDGRKVPTEYRVSFINDEEGNPKYLISVGRDITERKRAQEELQNERNKLQSIVDSIEYGLTIQDKDFNIIFQNRVMQGIFVESIGKKCYEVYEGKNEICEGCPIKLAYEDGKSHTVERKTILPTGEITYWENTASPIKDSRGNITACLEITRIITERKKADEELRNLRNYLSNIINSMPSILVGVDKEGNVTQWNSKAQNVTGISVEEAVGKPLNLVFPRLNAEMKRVREAMLRRKVYFKPRHPYKDKDEIHYEDVTVYPLVVNGVDGAVIRIDDVTDQVRIEEMMIQSEKMLSVGGLAAGMAHEINNPLAGMMQTASVMGDRLTNLELPANLKAAKEAGTTMEAIQAFMESRSIFKMLDRINKSGSRAAEIVSNMLSFAKKGSSTFSSQDIIQLLDQSVDLASSDYDLKRKYDFRQIEIVREYEKDMPLIYCESGKIQQVFMNILRNGAEAMNEKNETGREKQSRFYLRVALEPDQKHVRIEIEDTGPGMDETTRKRIFEPFFTTKPTDQGTGLGLSVSYFIIAENHGGTLSVEATPGNRFKIHNPASYGKEKTLINSIKTVLVLDDDDSSRESIVDFFEDRGWNVISAASAEKAINLLTQESTDCALVDIRLPGMDGNIFMRTISKTHPNLACVIVTGSPDYYIPEDIQKLPQIADRIFIKPIQDLSLLEEALKQQIRCINRKQ